MNEPRTIIRSCADCGEWFDVKLSGKRHWWNKRKILSGGKYFDKLEQPYRGRIYYEGLEDNKLKRNMGFFKYRLTLIYEFFEKILDPPEMVEYWICSKCDKKGL